MKLIFSFYRVINALSLDVAVGAVVGAVFFARLFGVSLLPQGLMALGLAVWIIYTADHLQDVRKIYNTPSTFRHALHQEKFKLLSSLLLASIVVELILLFFLRKQVVYNGLWLGCGVIVYVIVNRWLTYFKEIAAALLYTSGVLLPAFSLKQTSISLTEELIVAQFFLIVLTNLILFSWMDFENDKKDHRHSLATYIGKKKMKATIWCLLMIFCALASITLIKDLQRTVILIVMQFALSIIFLFPDFFQQRERFRFLGDAIFFLPALTFLL